MSEIHQVGVISDTHIPFRAKRVPEAALDLFERAGVELILHAGDLSSLAVIDQLEAYAPVEAVQGNVEMDEVVRRLPLTRELVVGGCAIGMVHNLGERRQYAENARKQFPDVRVRVSTQFAPSPDGSKSSGSGPESGRWITNSACGL